jgi:hypothetical protein
MEAKKVPKEFSSVLEESFPKFDFCFLKEDYFEKNSNFANWLGKVFHSEKDPFINFCDSSDKLLNTTDLHLARNLREGRIC